MRISEKFISSILEVKYTSPDGTLKNVFDHIKGSMIYRCVLCSATCNSHSTLYQHAHGKRHQRVIGLVDMCGDKEIIQKPLKLKTETDRPQNLDKVKASKLQLEIDKTRIYAIIGLEYIIETISNSETYYCILCKYTFDQKSRVINHLTAAQHRLKYLQKHFPRVFDDLNHLTQTVCECIEEKFGRLSVLLADEKEFTENRHKFTEIVMKMKHIDENMGSLDLLKMNFKEEVKDCVPVKLDTISISSGASSDNEDSMPVDAMSSNCNSRQTHIQQQVEKIKDQQENTMSSNYSSTPIHVKQQEDKIKSFRVQMAVAAKELKVTYLTYSSDPYTYPGYRDMWAEFWNTRYKESSSNSEVDWKREWSSEWHKILKEKFEKDLQSKRSELKDKLGILGSEVPENDQVTTQSSKDTEKGVEVKTGNVETCERAVVSTIKLCTTLSGSSASTSTPYSRRSNSRRRSRSPTVLNSTRRSHSTRRSDSPRRSHNTLRSRSPRNSHTRKYDNLPFLQKRRMSHYYQRPASRRSHSPRRSRSPQRIKLHRRSRRNNRSPDETSQKHHPHKTARSEKCIPIKRFSASETSLEHTQYTLPQNQKQTSDIHQKDTSSGKCRSPLQLEKLVDLYQRDSDFLISWKELLKILNIDDNDNLPVVEGNNEFVPSQIINNNAIEDHSIMKTTNYVELNEWNKVIQQPPCYPLEELVVVSEFVDKPVTIISVLKHITALEDLLGPCLGPKLIELMNKAKAMDKSNANSSNTLLDDNHSDISFKTIKEKLKGLLIAGLVENIKQNAVEKAIKDMEYLIHQATLHQISKEHQLLSKY